MGCVSACMQCICAWVQCECACGLLFCSAMFKLWSSLLFKRLNYKHIIINATIHTNIRMKSDRQTTWKITTEKMQDNMYQTYSALYRCAAKIILTIYQCDNIHDNIRYNKNKMNSDIICIRIIYYCVYNEWK